MVEPPSCLDWLIIILTKNARGFGVLVFLLRRSECVVFYPFSPLPVAKPIVFEKPQLLIFLSIHSSLSMRSSWEQIAALFPFFFQFLHPLFSCWDLSRGAFWKELCTSLPTCHHLNQHACIVHLFSVVGFAWEFVVQGFHCCKDLWKLLLYSRWLSCHRHT